MMCAKDILKEKGYVAPKFDTAGFMEEVGKYFSNNSINSKLLLVPYRFADIEWEKWYTDEEFERMKKEYEEDKKMEKYEEFEEDEEIEEDEEFCITNEEYELTSPYDFTREDESRGYKAQTVADSYWGIKEAKNYSESNRMQQEEAGILVPRIIIDKPFFENAAQMLKVMGGYVLERKMKKRVKLYYVSLI